MTTKFSINRSRVQPTPHVCRSLQPGVARTVNVPQTWVSLAWHAAAAPSLSLTTIQGTATIQRNTADPAPIVMTIATPWANLTIAVPATFDQAENQIEICTVATGPTILSRSVLRAAPKAPTIECWRLQFGPQDPNRPFTLANESPAAEQTGRIMRIRLAVT